MKQYKTKTGIVLSVVQGGGQTTPRGVEFEGKRYHNLTVVGGSVIPGLKWLWRGWDNFGFVIWDDWYSKGIIIRMFGREYHSEKRHNSIDKIISSRDNKVS